MSAVTARSHLGQIMRRAKENNERFVVDRRGEPQVIIMSVDDFIRTIAPPPEVLTEIWAESKRKGLNKLTMREINAEIAAHRREKRKKSAATQSAKPSQFATKAHASAATTHAPAAAARNIRNATARDSHRSQLPRAENMNAIGYS